MLEADKWLRRHGYIVKKNTYNFDSPGLWRYRQHDPDESKYYYRVYPIDKRLGIKFVLEYSK